MSISPSNWTSSDYARRRRSNNGIQIYGGFYYEEAIFTVVITYTTLRRKTMTALRKCILIPTMSHQ